MCERDSFLASTKDHIYCKDDVTGHTSIFGCALSDWEHYKNGFGKYHKQQLKYQVNTGWLKHAHNM